MTARSNSRTSVGFVESAAAHRMAAEYRYRFGGDLLAEYEADLDESRRSA